VEGIGLNKDSIKNQNKKSMKANDIFIEFERMAIEWGKAYQIVKVGDIVFSKLGGNFEKPLKINCVSVTIGRNSKTTRKTLVMEYSGRRLYKNGDYVDDVGSGVWLREFRTEDGKVFNHLENEVNEEENDVGFTFYIEFDPEDKKLYPQAYSSYKENIFENPYTR
jgi:hypothetical protein